MATVLYSTVELHLSGAMDELTCTDAARGAQLAARARVGDASVPRLCWPSMRIVCRRSSAVVAVLAGAAIAYLYTPSGHEQRVVHITAHHKSGFVFSDGLVAQLRQLPAMQGHTLWWRPDWKGHVRTFRRPVVLESLPSPWSIVINVVRDPFTIVVSGMRYHRGVRLGWGRWSGQECWGEQPASCCDRTIFGHRASVGLDDLTRRALEFGLPRPTQKRYCQYLQSLNESNALLAEMLRTWYSDFADMLGSWRTTQRHPSTMRSVCLEAFAPTRFRETMASLLRFARLPDTSVGGTPLVQYLEARLANASLYASHSTQKLKGFRLSKRAHLAWAQTWDKRYFGGAFARAARELGCSDRDGIAAPSRHEPTRSQSGSQLQIHSRGRYQRPPLKRYHHRLVNGMNYTTGMQFHD